LSDYQQQRICFEPASVSSRRAEEVKRRRSDGGSEPERNAAAELLTEADAIAIHESVQDEQAEMLRAGAESAEAGRGISACWSWQSN
jgi:hypothetical protein